MNASGRERGTICPRWCQRPVSHVAGSHVTGDTTHTRLVAEIYLAEIDGIRDTAEEPVRVEIEAFTDLDGHEHPPTIRLTLSSASGASSPDADDLTPAEARRLAAVLLKAARTAES